jgi:putative spermidine/putrescine transport system ATP-binding protein
MDAKLELRNLGKAYGHNQVVNDVSLTVADNELVTLLGPSGSGKTTTMMMIAGFVAPDSGEILLDGRSILDVPPYRRNIGVVFQSYALFPHMSVAANVEFPLRQHRIGRGASRRKAQELLALVGLEEFGQRSISQLSGGQQQRVALARALAVDPPLLIMDEPLSALDKRLREQMQDEIKRIQQAVGVTVLCVTHDQTEAFVLSDRIAVMNEGRILQVGPPREVYDFPANDFVADFLGESNVFRGSLQRAGGEPVFCADGGLKLSILADAPAGNAVVVIRPERVEISGAATRAAGEPISGMTTLSGKVVNSSFVGSSTTYRVDCDGVLFRVRCPSVATTPFSYGETVFLRIPTDACVVLP